MRARAIAALLFAWIASTAFTQHAVTVRSTALAGDGLGTKAVALVGDGLGTKPVALAFLSCTLHWFSSSSESFAHRFRIQVEKVLHECVRVDGLDAMATQRGFPEMGCHDFLSATMTCCSEYVTVIGVGNSVKPASQPLPGAAANRELAQVSR